VSDVRLLPFDLERETTFHFHDGNTHTGLALDFIRWKPDEHQLLSCRVRYYRWLVRSAEARNVREAVKMLAAKRREWEADQTARRAALLASKAQGARSSSYAKALPRKKEILLAEGQPCAYCGTPHPRTVDHIMPTSRGGDHRRKNLAPACKRCNSEKGNRTPAEWRDDRIRSGLPWPPPPSGETPSAFASGLTNRRLTPVQLAVLRDLTSGGTSRIHPLTLAALERHGLIKSQIPPIVVTERGRLAAASGRHPLPETNRSVEEADPS
jgi:5-methylcytosine-specific restriction endonuclease McrA